MVERGGLIRLLGRERYIRFYAWLHDLNPMLGLAAMLIPAAVIWAFVFSPDDHEHDGYLLGGDVLFTNTTSSEQSSFIFTAVVKLPNGQTATVRTRLMAVASQTVDTACLERRKEVDGGDVFYRLVGQIKCNASSGQ